MIKLIALSLFLSLSLLAQTRNVQLTWTPPIDLTGVNGYKVYRGLGNCSTSPALTAISTPPVPLGTNTYTDNGVATGTYCYKLTSVTLSGATVTNESAFSVGANAIILPPLGVPTGLSTTVVTVIVKIENSNGALVASATH